MDTYRVEDNEIKNLTTEYLNKLSNEDWEIHLIIPYNDNYSGQRVKIILKK